MFSYIFEIKSHMAQAGFEITMFQGCHCSPEPPASISQVLEFQESTTIYM